MPIKRASPEPEGPILANTTADSDSTNDNNRPEQATSDQPANGVHRMEKIWLNSYPQGVPAEIGPLPFPSVATLITDSCKRFAVRTAFNCMGSRMTYAALDRMSAAFAGFLQSQGLQKGDRVAVMLPNVLQYPVAVAGILRGGFVVVNVNPLYTAHELQHQLKDSGAKAIVVLENFAGTLQKAIVQTDLKHVIVATMGDLLGIKGPLVNFVVRRVKKMVPRWSLPGYLSFNAALAVGARAGTRPVETGTDDLAFLQYTGGTTGTAKGAMLTHRNMVANVVQTHLWFSAAFDGKQRPEQLVNVCALPLYHIFGLMVNMLMAITEGAENIMIPNPRDIPGLVATLRKRRINVFPGLNTLFNALLNNPDFEKVDFSGLMISIAAGMPVQRPMAERWQAVTGCSVTEGYGLSETSPVVTVNRFDNNRFVDAIGLPLPSTEVVIRDEAGRDVPLGVVGEICIRGPQVMAGYWNRPEETAQVMAEDGFFRSGDMGFMDEQGYIRIVDRKKDMILVSGFNVYPTEIEEAAAAHPGILEAAAIGIPNPHSGEAVKLLVVRKEPAVTADDIKAFLAERLTNYKRPREIEFRDSLPKSNVGKILRRELRATPQQS